MAPSREDQSIANGQLVAGIDAGSVSVNGILIDEQKRIIHESPYQRHFGKVEETVAALVEEIYARFGPERIAGVAFTGSHGKLLSERVGAPYEFEIISQVLGAVHIRPDVRTIIGMGGQDTALMQIGHTGSGWELEFFNTNGPCASGTGSFIDQQAERLAIAMYERRGEHRHQPVDIVLADFIALGLKSRQPASVACRCTVFTKSDMIHLQNKGERLEDIIHGLHVGNARNYLSTIVSNRALHDPILFIGGLSLNRLQVQALQEYFPGLEVPPRSTSIGLFTNATSLPRGNPSRRSRASSNTCRRNWDRNWRWWGWRPRGQAGTWSVISSGPISSSTRSRRTPGGPLRSTPPSTPSSRSAVRIPSTSPSATPIPSTST